jgi:hypothetical protein
MKFRVMTKFSSKVRQLLRIEHLPQRESKVSKFRDNMRLLNSNFSFSSFETSDLNAEPSNQDAYSLFIGCQFFSTQKTIKLTKKSTETEKLAKI